MGITKEVKNKLGGRVKGVLFNFFYFRFLKYFFNLINVDRVFIELKYMFLEKYFSVI